MSVDSIEALRIASTGATVAARRAGTTAAATVTPMPTAKAATIVELWTTREASGKSRPNWANTHISPRATPSPAVRPPIAASSPIIAASSTTEPRTWRRLAPIARTRASSLVLRDRDRERVGDGERADEECDGTEDEQNRLEHA